MTKDKALKLALEALIHKAGMNPVMQGSCYAMHPEALQAVIDEAIKQALAARQGHEPENEPYVSLASVREDWGPGPHEVHSLPPAAPVQEPVAWLIDGRYTTEFLDIAETWRNKGSEVEPLYTTPPAQPAPVKVWEAEGYDSLMQEMQMVKARNIRQHAEIERLKAAQPAVPDAFGTREGEHPQYIQGWNDCRVEMLKGMKP